MTSASEPRMGQRVGPTAYYVGRDTYDHVCADPECDGYSPVEPCEPLDESDGQAVTMAIRRSAHIPRS